MVNSSKNFRFLPILYATPAILVVIFLFIYWFWVADRYLVFLYYHDMGPLVPSTAPFSFVTRSRYWMAGFVASGCVMIINMLSHRGIHFFFNMVQPPSWIKIWIVTAFILCICIPFVLMTSPQRPRLPFGLSLWVTAITLAGLAFAFIATEYASKRPLEAFLYAIDGTALALILIGLPGIEHLPDWIKHGKNAHILVLSLMVAGGYAISLAATGLRVFLKRLVTPAKNLYIAGLCVAYPVMSLVHHIFGTDGYFYITDSDNFFARNLLVQALVWSIVWGICLSIAWSRVKLIRYIGQKKKTQHPAPR